MTPGGGASPLKVADALKYFNQDRIHIEGGNYLAKILSISSSTGESGANFRAKCALDKTIASRSFRFSTFRPDPPVHSENRLVAFDIFRPGTLAIIVW